MRDFQRQKVYDSDRQFRTKYKSEIQYYKNVKEVKIFTDIILSNTWFKQFNINQINISESPSKITAYGWLENETTIAIQLPKYKWSMNQITILHEIAHGLCSKYFSYDNIAFHGPEFISAYLDLIYYFLGKNHFMNMHEILTKNKVKYTFSN